MFPNFVRKFAAGGAEVLFNISNDGWFGKSAAREQHLSIVRMRAAENRRWILRSTNDGITATIDSAGRLRGTLPLYVEATSYTGFNYESSADRVHAVRGLVPAALRGGGAAGVGGGSRSLGLKAGPSRSRLGSARDRGDAGQVREVTALEKGRSGDHLQIVADHQGNAVDFGGSAFADPDHPLQAFGRSDRAPLFGLLQKAEDCPDAFITRPGDVGAAAEFDGGVGSVRATALPRRTRAGAGLPVV